MSTTPYNTEELDKLNNAELLDLMGVVTERICLILQARCERSGTDPYELVRLMSVDYPLH
jgi:hypothetical protein|tara:strand:- start:57 stop:236 length:180 start_codon:yes stop_codon:yes gene_type:complete